MKLSRFDAEQQALILSHISGGPWLVVDCGDIYRHQYRVWSELTQQSQSRECPDCLPHYEIVSRCEHGTINQIA